MSKLFNAKPIHWTYWIAMTGLWLGLLFANIGPSGANWGPIVRYTGQVSWYLMVFTVYISLLSRMFPKQLWLAKLFSLRKHTGIAAFMFALMHLLGEYMKRMSFGMDSFLDFLMLPFTQQNAMLFGWIAFLLIVPAFLTSTSWAIKRLGFKKWKLLQRLVHISFVFVALHVGLLRFFSGGPIDWEPLITIFIYSVGYVVLMVRLDQINRKKLFTAAGPTALLILLALSIPVPSLAGNSTGVDAIIAEIGQERPAEWLSWNRDQRFEYLQSMGIYPSADGNYGGEAGDLTAYFAWLGVEQPANWDSLSVAQRREFVLSLQDGTTPAVSATPPQTTPIAPADLTEPAANNWLKYYWVLVGLVMGIGLMLASYKVDWLRTAKRH